MARTEGRARCADAALTLRLHGVSRRAVLARWPGSSFVRRDEIMYELAVTSLFAAPIVRYLAGGPSASMRCDSSDFGLKVFIA